MQNAQGPEPTVLARTGAHSVRRFNLSSEAKLPPDAQKTAILPVIGS
jgi:hypothetical protein